MLGSESVSWLRGHLFQLGIGATFAVLAILWAFQSKHGKSWLYFRMRRAAVRRVWVILGPAAAVLAIRAAALPVWEKPVPAVLDEFSYLLLGDTFASGRATNPPHPMWEHFETLFVLQRPTYASAYPPAQGLALAAGQKLGGHPWWGVWLSAGVMCAALGWMLYGWLPPVWAMLGAAWAGAQLGLISYWMNSYWGGNLSAIGGALLLGAASRIQRDSRTRDAALLGLGLVLLANSRPYEGLVLGLVTVVWLGLQARRRPFRMIVTPAIVIVAGFLASAWYYSRVTGSFFRMPAQEYMRQYAASPIFIWQTPPPQPVYRHTVLRDAHLSFLVERDQFRTASGGLRLTAWKLLRLGAFYLGPLILLPVLMGWWLWRTRLRFLVIASVVTGAGVLVTVPLQPHYAAPLAGAFYGLAMQSLRILWIVGRRGNPFGRFVAAAAPAVVVVMMSLTFATERPPTLLGQKPALEDALAAAGGRHLVIVRYAQVHNLAEEWVYNRADIDRAIVVWARDMGGKRNEELIRYYPERRIWILDADARPSRLAPYPR